MGQPAVRQWWFPLLFFSVGYGLGNAFADWPGKPWDTLVGLILAVVVLLLFLSQTRRMR